MYLVPVAEFDLKYFLFSVLGINCLLGLIFYFPDVLILGQGRTLVPRGILHTIGLPLSSKLGLNTKNNHPRDQVLSHSFYREWRCCKCSQSSLNALLQNGMGRGNRRCATLLPQGVDTDQLWRSCVTRLLLGEVTVTHEGHMPGTPMLVSHFCWGKVTLTHESRMPGAPALQWASDVLVPVATKENK